MQKSFSSMGKGTSMQSQIEELFRGKSEAERPILARSAGAHFAGPGGSLSDRRAAEELANHLARDAIEAVREQLSKAVRHCRFLPHDVAMTIAHDVDAVSCPFLEVTEVFSEADWRQLVRSISSGARVTVARRPDLSEGVVESLAEAGDAQVAETLIGNMKAPINQTAYSAIIVRLEETPWILDSMVEQRSLPPEVAVMLVSKVSKAAQEKLAERYDLNDFTSPVVAEATDGTLLRVIQDADSGQLLEYARSLYRLGELDPSFLMQALQFGCLEFFEAAMAVRGGIPIDNARKLIRGGGDRAILRLCEKARIPQALWKDIQRTVDSAIAAID